MAADFSTALDIKFEPIFKEFYYHIVEKYTINDAKYIMSINNCDYYARYPGGKFSHVEEQRSNNIDNYRCYTLKNYLYKENNAAGLIAINYIFSYLKIKDFDIQE